MAHLARTPFRKVHDLRELLELLPADAKRSLVTDDLDVLNPWALEGRYPGDVSDAMPTDASECINAAERVIGTVRSAVE